MRLQVAKMQLYKGTCVMKVGTVIESLTVENH